MNILFSLRIISRWINYSRSKANRTTSEMRVKIYKKINKIYKQIYVLKIKKFMNNFKVYEKKYLIKTWYLLKTVL